jgi:hypothetical protein
VLKASRQKHSRWELRRNPADWLLHAGEPLCYSDSLPFLEASVASFSLLENHTAFWTEERTVFSVG